MVVPDLEGVARGPAAAEAVRTAVSAATLLLGIVVPSRVAFGVFIPADFRCFRCFAADATIDLSAIT